MYRDCTDFAALLLSGHLLLSERAWSNGHGAPCLVSAADRDELGLGVAERVDEHARMDKLVL